MNSANERDSTAIGGQHSGVPGRHLQTRKQSPPLSQERRPALFKKQTLQTEGAGESHLRGLHGSGTQHSYPGKHGRPSEKKLCVKQRDSLGCRRDLQS